MVWIAKGAVGARTDGEVTRKKTLQMKKPRLWYGRSSFFRGGATQSAPLSYVWEIAASDV